MSMMFLLAAVRLQQAFAAQIIGSSGYAWSSKQGWVNWKADNGGVVVTDTKLSGYIWLQNGGWVILDPDQGGVINDGTGQLSGHAWGDKVGWVDFEGVKIENGIFTGQASGELVGTLTFDCDYCEVRTNWRILPNSSSVPSKDEEKSNNKVKTQDPPAPAPPNVVLQPSRSIRPIERQQGGASEAGSANSVDAAETQPRPSIFRPEKLFDISLSVEGEKFRSLSEVEALVTMDSFGTVPTEIKLVLGVVSENGQTLFETEVMKVVETAQVHRQTFPELALEDGKYKVRLVTEYGEGIQDEFVREIVIQKNSPAILALLYGGLSMLLLGLLLKRIHYSVRSAYLLTPNTTSNESVNNH